MKNKMERGEMPDDAVEATLVLIPKGSKPKSMRDFRLLRLCNVVSWYLKSLSIG